MPEEPTRTADQLGHATSAAKSAPPESPPSAGSPNGDNPQAAQPLAAEKSALDASAITRRDLEAERDHWRERAVLWRERALAAELVAKVLQKHVEDLRANVRDLRTARPSAPVVRQAQPVHTASTWSSWKHSLQERCSQLVDRYGTRAALPVAGDSQRPAPAADDASAIGD